MSDRDYTPQTGELEFKPGQLKKEIRIPIVDDANFEKDEAFEVELTYEAGPPRGALSENAKCTVNIVSDDKTKELCDRVAVLVNLNVDKYKVGSSNYKQQFIDAVSMESDEDDGPPSAMAKAMHFITLPFKVLFAFVPPTDYAGGWLCFVVALIFIGGVTTFIGDFAALFGCAAGLKPSVTAITLVALGTSLPDTFASKAAALGDDTADAAVGNVTGSNAVNVFLGLGMPWTLAAFYWHLELGGDEALQSWREAYGYYDTATASWVEGKTIAMFAEENVGSLNGRIEWNPDTNARSGGGEYGFAVNSTGLGESVGVFCVCALACLGTLYYRRVTLGAELGGPAAPAKTHAIFFVGLWFTYVIFSTVMAYSESSDC